MQARGDVIGKPVMTPDLVEQFINEPRDFADALDRALRAQANQCLRFIGGRRIYAVSESAACVFCRTAGAQTRWEQSHGHRATCLRRWMAPVLSLVEVIGAERRCSTYSSSQGAV